MKKIQPKKDTELEMFWNPACGKWVERAPCKKNPKSKPEKEYSEKEMIRDLKGVFCKGRYASWSQRHHAAKEK